MLYIEVFLPAKDNKGIPLEDFKGNKIKDSDR
jgi:hypothetical protein